MAARRVAWLLCAAGLAVLALVPAGIGWLAERLLPPGAEITTGWGAGHWQPLDYRRGWFASEAVSRLVLEVDGQRREIELHHQVRHWPVSFDSLAHFDTRHADDGQEGHARTELLWSGATRSAIHLPPGLLDFSGDGAMHIETGAGTAQLVTTPGGAVALTARWPRAAGLGPSGALTIEALEVFLDGTGAAESVAGRIEARRFGWQPRQGAGIAMDDPVLELALSRDGNGLADGQGVLTFRALESAKTRTGPGRIGIQAARLDPELLGRLVRMQRAGESDGLAWGLALLALAQQRPMIRIEPLSVQTAEGPVDGQMDLSVRDPGSGRLVLDPNLLVLDARLVAPEPFARAWLTVALDLIQNTEPDGTNPDAVDALIRQFERLGWIERQADGRLLLSLKFRDGRLRGLR